MNDLHMPKEAVLPHTGEPLLSLPLCSGIQANQTVFLQKDHRNFSDPIDK